MPYPALVPLRLGRVGVLKLSPKSGAPRGDVGVLRVLEFRNPPKEKLRFKELPAGLLISCLEGDFCFRDIVKYFEAVPILRIVHP